MIIRGRHDVFSGCGIHFQANLLFSRLFSPKSKLFRRVGTSLVITTSASSHHDRFCQGGVTVEWLFIEDFDNLRIVYE